MQNIFRHNSWYVKFVTQKTSTFKFAYVNFLSLRQSFTLNPTAMIETTFALSKKKKIDVYSFQ